MEAAFACSAERARRTKEVISYGIREASTSGTLNEALCERSSRLWILALFGGFL